MGTDLRRLKRVLTAQNAGLLLERFEERTSVFENRLRKAKREPSENAVHSLRVAARRFLSLLTLLEAVMPAVQVTPVRRRIRKRLRNLRSIRDVQVQILHSEQLLADFPQLYPFHRSLRREERLLVKRVGTELHEFRMRRLRERMQSLLEALIGSFDPDEDDALGSRIKAAIEDDYRRVLSLRARIDPQKTASIHQTRLAFKNFRYMSEIAAPLFSELDEERLEAMHAYQDRMGAIQDMESLLSTMTDFRRRSGRTSILVVENEIRRRRQRQVDEFMKVVDELRFFWSTPKTETREVG